MLGRPVHSTKLENLPVPPIAAAARSVELIHSACNGAQYKAEAIAHEEFEEVRCFLCPRWTLDRTADDAGSIDACTWPDSVAQDAARGR